MPLLALFIVFALTNVQSQHVTGNNFIMVNKAMNYASAKAYCANTFGTTLASVHSASENSEAGKLCANSGSAKVCSFGHVMYPCCWLGLNDIVKEKTWVWEDKSRVDYTKWAPGEPNYGGEDCVEIYPSIGKSLVNVWNNKVCSYKRYFLCNKPQDSAEVWAHCDNSLTVKQRNRGGIWKTIGTETNWVSPFHYVVIPVSQLTELRFECVDKGYIGGFIATVNYGGVMYSTVEPMSQSKFSIVEGDTTTLKYHEKTAAPWKRHTEGIASNAKWIWNGQTYNAMTFEFSFDGLAPSPSRCDLLDIDHYLADCSDEFVANEADIDSLKKETNSLKNGLTNLGQKVEKSNTNMSGQLTKMSAQINGKAAVKDVSALQSKVAQKADTTYVDALKADLKTVETDFGAFGRRLEAVEEHLSHFVKASAHQFGPNVDGYNVASPNQNLVIGALVVLNVATVIGCIACLCMKIKAKKGVVVYDGVQQQE